MGLYYFDSSALLKRYIAEIGSHWVSSLVATGYVAISLLTFAELASALGRRWREGLLTAQQQGVLYRRFVAESGAFITIDLTRSVVEDAASLLADPAAPAGLRTLDALHIVSAGQAFGWARANGQDIAALVSADRALNRAAQWAGLITLSPEDYP